jgi:Ni/Fe-hydrogenase 1 B-type cytochrome subunit
MREAAYRPWAIATRNSAGHVWRLAGLVPVRENPVPRKGSGDYVFVPLWSLLLRSLHWLWVILIATLVVTGFEIQSMVLSVGTSRIQTGFFFGYIRLAHFLCGWLLAAVVLLRIADALRSRGRFESWRAMIPFRSGKDIEAFFDSVRNYALVRTDEGRAYLGHDPLANVSFAGCYLVMILAVISGFSLYGLYEPQDGFFRWFVWPARHFGAAQVRLFHVVMMWLLILFVPAHIYLVIRADGYARAGSLSAMIGGGRWVRKGASFEDA